MFFIFLYDEGIGNLVGIWFSFDNLKGWVNGIFSCVNCFGNYFINFIYVN